MLARQTETLLFHVKRLGLLNLVLAFLYIANDTFLFQFRERILYGFDVVFLQFSLDDGVVGPVDEGILWRLVLDDTHLGIHIVLHLKVIPVKVIGRDVQQNGNVCTEVVHVIQLE